MACADKKLVLMEKKLAQLYKELHTPGLFTHKAHEQWTTLNTHLKYFKKHTELDKKIAKTEEEMQTTLDAAEAADDKTPIYTKWAELNTHLNELVKLKAELAEEEIESKAIDAILNAEVKLY